MNIAKKIEIVSYIYLSSVLLYFGDFNGQVLTAELNNGPSDSYNGVVGLIILILIGVFILLYRKYLFTTVPNFKILLTIFFFYLAISIFRSNSIEGVRNLSNVVVGYLNVLALSFLCWTLPLHKTVRLFNIVFSIFLWLCLYIHLTKVGTISLQNHDSVSRLGGLYFYGITGVISGFNTIINFINLLVSRTYRGKALYMLNFLSMVGFTLASDMRNALIALIFCLTLIIFLRSIKFRSKLISLLFLTSIFTGVIISINIYQNKAVAGKSTQDDLDHRAVIWDLALQSISKSPLTGYGKENVFLNSIKAQSFKEGLNDAHSSILNLVLHGGIIVACLIFLYFAKSCWIGFKLPMPLNYFSSIPIYWFVATLTGGNFFTGAFNIQFITWASTMLCICAHPYLRYHSTAYKKRDSLKDQIHETHVIMQNY